MPVAFRGAERTFDSLKKCVTHLHSQFPNSKSLDEPIRFLFRGEAKLYPSTLSTDARLTPDLREAIGRLRSLVVAELTSFFGRADPSVDAPSRDAIGYVQHYGFPTTLIDFTSNPLVAAYFASKGRHGLIGVLDVDVATHRAKIVDLRQHALAQRAQTQHAFALSGYSTDLKTEAARTDLGMRWFRVRVSTADALAFREIAYVEDSHFDVTAGLVTSSMYGVIRKAGKLADDVAGFLASRLPPLPQMFRVREEGPEAVTPAQSGAIYLPSGWRERHHRIWSRDYADTEADLPWPAFPVASSGSQPDARG